MKTFDWHEIKSNDCESSCWTVIDNKVYDLTSFLN